jgi:hypothetical protein
MAAEEPQIPDLADRRLGRDLGHGISRVVILLGHVIERGDPQIDLGHLEAGDLEAEIEPEEREVLEASTRSSQVAISVSLLSAIAKARAWAWVR